MIIKMMIDISPRRWFTGTCDELVIQKARCSAAVGEARRCNTIGENCTSFSLLFFSLTRLMSGGTAVVFTATGRHENRT